MLGMSEQGAHCDRLKSVSGAGQLAENKLGGVAEAFGGCKMTISWC